MMFWVVVSFSLVVDTHVLKACVAFIFNVKLRNWYGYIGIFQGRWSLRPMTGGTEMEPGPDQSGLATCLYS
jgi:hypothetical protein